MIALQQHVKLYSMPIVVVAWDAIQTITHPQNFYAYFHEAINGYFYITPHFSGLWEGLVQLIPCDSYKGTL